MMFAYNRHTLKHISSGTGTAGKYEATNVVLSQSFEALG